MANIWRLRVGWSGSAVVGPGVSTFHFLPDSPGVVAGVKSLFEQLRNYTPTIVNWEIPDGGEVIDVASGQAVAVWSQSGGGSVQSEGQPAHAAGVGGRIVWQTAGFNNGRRVRGTTFLVPLSGNIYDNQGTLSEAMRTGMQTRVDTFLGALDGEMVIYSHRPGSSTGATAVVVSGTLPDKVSWLRSRRT